MSIEQENKRQIVLEIAGVTDATRVGDLTVRQFVELIIRVYEQPPVRRVPTDQRAVDEAIAEIRRLIGSLDEAFQRVQAAILSKFPSIIGSGGTPVRMDDGPSPHAGGTTAPSTRVREGGGD